MSSCNSIIPALAAAIICNRQDENEYTHNNGSTKRNKKETRHKRLDFGDIFFDTKEL